jgi:5'-nucleotidase / UDP-sugar diphosphatase
MLRKICLVVGTFLLLFSCLVFINLHLDVSQKSAFNLRIIHTNDHHAHLQPIRVEDCELGGITRRKSLIDRIRLDNKNKNEPLLLLDAGDIFQGTLYFNQYEGQADLFFYNALNYNASTIGNHEFDLGQQVLANFIDNANFPILSANIQTNKSSPLTGKIKPWTIFEIQGEKIGVFGLTTKEASVISKSIDGITFIDHITAARDAIHNLKNQGVNKIIALTHIGIDADRDLASLVDDIDIIVGGHSHTLVGNIPGATVSYPLIIKSPNGHNILIVTDWEWGKYLGDIRIGFDTIGNVISWQGSPQPLDEHIKPNLEFQAKLEEFAKPIEKLKHQIIGKSTVTLDGNYAKVRSEETNLGDLIANAMLDQLRSDGAQIAIFNAGNIRNGIPKGDISMAQVLEVLPFRNKIARIDLTGAQLKIVLENGVSQVEELAGRFPQVAGLRFFWNSSASIGNRVTSIRVLEKNGDFTPINLNAIYRIATNDFLFNGNDGFNIFKTGINPVKTHFILSEIVTNYITTHSPIDLKTRNRVIRIIN